MRRVGVIAVALLISAQSAAADDEAANRSYVAASEYGNCYARSRPSESYGTSGQTIVYSVEEDGDRVAYTYNWFAPQMRLECNVAGPSNEISTSVVQFGPAPRGQRADAQTLALAFYWNGRLMHRYSTLDIAGSPTNVSVSESHYAVIDEIPGYRVRTSNYFDFAVHTVDGRTLTFDAATGSLRQSSPRSAD